MLYIFEFISIFPETTDQFLHTGNITQCSLSIYEKKLWVSNKSCQLNRVFGHSGIRWKTWPIQQRAIQYILFI